LDNLGLGSKIGIETAIDNSKIGFGPTRIDLDHFI
jgi:hypothetical protein